MYPQLNAPNNSRRMVDVFRGYNHNLKIGEGEFFEMKNMTSDYYPLLSPRGKRGVYTEGINPQGLIAKDALCYVDGGSFVVNGYPVDMKLSTDEDMCPKQLVSMGAYVIILPDKKWINTADLTEYGDIDAQAAIQGDITFTLCKADGSAHQVAYTQATTPEAPGNMELWVDTSAEPHVLKQWSESAGMWASVATTYVKIEYEGIGLLFEQYDGITISGLKEAVGEEDQLAALEGSAVVWDKGNNYIVVVGILDVVRTVNASITVSRKMPAVDYITESGNRLWGCRYGLSNDGQVVNEIYASKLGDFKNWNCFMGVSTDSFSVQVGTDGQFTGAITHLGYPLFFKENCVHQIYGSYPANFGVQTTACRGVQKGCSRSLAIVGEILYYKARHAVCAFDGSLPVEVSTDLGEVRYDNAVAGAHGNKYYISMRDVGEDKYSLFVYDTAKGMWHREDERKLEAFCSCREELYAIEGSRIITMLGSGDGDTERLDWMVQTGPLTTDMPDMKYISRITVRMALEIGTKVRFLAQYDSDGGWESLGNLSGISLRSFSIPIRPRRCDHFRFRIEGAGGAKIYSITQTIEQGSDLS